MPLVVREDVLESPESLENLMRCVELCGGQSSSDLLEPRADTTRDAALLTRGTAHVFLQLLEQPQTVDGTFVASANCHRHLFLGGRDLALKWPADQRRVSFECGSYVDGIWM